LSRGVYIFFVDKRAGEKVDLRNIYPKEKMISLKSTYKQCLDREVDWDSRDINYLELRGELARIRKNEPDSIFDVTAIKKSFIGDIIACCLLEGIHNVYTFDLEYTPNFDEPWKMLFHELRSDTLEESFYRYTNIVYTPIFRECSHWILFRTPPMKISLFVVVVLLLTILGVYFYFGEPNWFIQIAYIVSVVASILTLFFALFPPRR